MKKLLTVIVMALNMSSVVIGGDVASKKFPSLDNRQSQKNVEFVVDNNGFTGFVGARYFMGVNLEKRVFKNKADFRDTKAQYTIFSHATLVEADFSGSVLNYGVYQFTSLERANFTSVQAMATTFEDAQLSNSVLNNAVFSGSNAQRANFSGARGQKFFLNCANAKEANFKNAEFRDGYFSESNFSGADFTNASLLRTDVSGAIFYGAHHDDILIDCKWLKERGAVWKVERPPFFGPAELDVKFSEDIPPR